ncbi:quinone oxidoreductase family protein [Amycolatopsis pithecellobii]|uniref:Zinc-binding dehydrogenase n=1 Tax=Amycolatopsis pithecellobii TaxID=664692 RepID=A0A6N7YW77_9PSEU|nr:zinc-binding dehydrogenase [Amycolatopsis pithecellobii]MTD52589.1 zinc-binding dehydrogenase [Amycolatopsis pithecellobii]
MKAIVVKSFGGPENLEPIEHPKPAPGPGQVLVAVESAGVGLADALLRQGFLPDVAPGFTPGLEMAGKVAEVGEGVDEAWLNSRVFAMVAEGIKSGCYAEFVAVDVDQLVPLPPTISSAEAVSLGVNVLAAEFVIRRAQIRLGEQVLVRGAGGGIGVMLVQLAARRGAIVTASTSSPERAERLLKLGASHAVDRAGAPLSGAAPERYDVILDTVAGPDLLTFSGKLNNNGRVVLAGVAGGLPPAELATALLDRRSLSFSLVSLDAVDLPERLSALREIFALVARGELTPIIHEVLDLERAADAHSKLEAGGVFGKIVLEVAR